jgi:hypothetical protein
VDEISLDDMRRSQIRSACDVLPRRRELLDGMRLRVNPWVATRRSRLWAQDPALAILDRLTTPECAPITAALIRAAEAIAVPPEAVARLFVLRVKADPPLLARLFEVPVERAEEMVAMASAQDRPTL